MPRNPPWAFEELVLALDLYVSSPRARQVKTDPGISDLSGLLQRLPLALERPDPERFRNPNAVYLKLQNFKAVDPGYDGQGMRRGAGAREDELFKRFADSPGELADLAHRIRAAAEDPGLRTAPEDENQGEAFPEGRLLFRLHKTRERRYADRKKRAVLKATGSLACEVCGFDFHARYGELGRGFAECHHTRPLALGERLTRLADLVIVCANCHAMLHRGPQPPSVAQLRQLLAAP